MEALLAEPLARIYDQAVPAIPSRGEMATLRAWIRAQWQQIPAQVRMTPAQITLSQAKQRYIYTGELLISTANNSHPYLSFMENAMFRAVHDWHHILAGADDTLQGEIATYYVARFLAPQSIWWMLRSEIVMQAAACIHFGDYQQQKLVRT